MNTIKPNWPALPHIKAYTTLRHAWGVKLTEVNQGHFSKNNPKCIEDSRCLEALLGLPEEPIWMTQTHSTTVILASPENKEQVADASYTNEPNRVCVVTTADCLPILLCNKQGTYVSAIHAGWRGLSNGIIEATVNTLRLPAGDLLVWLGPAIGPKKFEVGQDVYDAFVLKHKESAAAFVPISQSKWLANLYELAKIRLRLQGVLNIYGGDFCTHTEEDLFFSYRRNKAQTGRMASVIWINK